MFANVRQTQTDVDDNSFRASNTGFAHAARNNRSVRRLAAAARQNTLGRKETVDVLRTRFLAHEDDFFTRIAELFGKIGVEDALARCGARRGRQAKCNRLCGALRIQARVQQLLQQFRIDAH